MNEIKVIILALEWPDKKQHTVLTSLDFQALFTSCEKHGPTALALRYGNRPPECFMGKTPGLKVITHALVSGQANAKERQAIPVVVDKYQVMCVCV